MLRSNRHWSFVSTEGNRYELYRVYLKKLVAITFTVFFGDGSSGKVHCFDCSFVSNVK